MGALGVLQGCFSYGVAAKDAAFVADAAEPAHELIGRCGLVDDG